MGKGDKKTRRGKIVIGSSGVTRRRKKNKPTRVPVESMKQEPVPVDNPLSKKTPAETRKKETPAEAKPAAKKSTAKKTPKTGTETAPE